VRILLPILVLIYHFANLLKEIGYTYSFQRPFIHVYGAPSGAKQLREQGLPVYEKEGALQNMGLTSS